MKVITLLTDFGLQDGYPGIMKGVIYKIIPDVRIADITHLISPQNILEGAIALSRSYRYFPAGTIHVAVIDPGVGTTRRPVAAQIGEHFFIGPDNGLFSLIVREAQAADGAGYIRPPGPACFLAAIPQQRIPWARYLRPGSRAPGKGSSTARSGYSDHRCGIVAGANPEENRAWLDRRSGCR